MPYPIIPEYITVHLGAPSEAAENVTVPFIDYIKNVASGEIYPTWPEESLIANILAQITFALNRIYTEWYPSQGYDFDITSVTRYDQSYEMGREIFANVSALVDTLFNNYVVKGESIIPYFTQYCNGTTSVCEGLSQWGTVELADRGYTALEILRHYYGDDINLVENAPTGENLPSYPGLPLALGTAGEEVRILQRELNRISRNFPAIPHVEVNVGVDDAATAAAVTAFQEIFDLPVTGIVDKATWYAIKRKYVAVKGLGELLGEGISYSEAERLYPRQLQLGDSGNEVRIVQYYLDVISYFEPDIPATGANGNFDEATETALKAFQEKYGLEPTGIADRETWDALTVHYNVLINTLPEEYQEYASLIYPSSVLVPGSTGQSVITLQKAINSIAETDSNVPTVQVTGYFGQELQEAVSYLQMIYGFPVTGYVGPLLWKTIISQSQGDL